jgi:transcriptional regulator with PAS, ATPase and Fis domain
MDFKLQAKLLQVLQDREFVRLGAKETCRVDVRVMAATHCNLEKAIEDGRFREDLYYRLNIIEVHIPPLRDRKDEIVSLAEFFLQKHGPNGCIEVPLRLKQVLIEHDWPGNVRELENVIRKFLVFRSVDLIAAELKRKSKNAPRQIANPIGSLDTPEQRTTSLPAPVAATNGDVAYEPALAYNGSVHSVASTNGAPEIGVFTPSIPRTGSRETPAHASILAEVDEARKKAEKDAILSALHSTLWNRKQAAKLLKIDYKALLYKMKKLGIGEKTPDTAAS